MVKKTKNVTVRTINKQITMSINSKTTGNALLSQVCRVVGIKEQHFFSFQYDDNHEHVVWMKLRNKVLSHKFKDSSNINLYFLFQTFPEDTLNEIYTVEALEHLCLQIHQSIINNLIHVSTHLAIMLAGYALQAERGDYEEKDYKIAVSELIPSRCLEQVKLSDEEWTNTISRMHKEACGLLKEEALMQYCRVAEDVEMYGVNYFNIQNNKKSWLFIGIDALGINIYEQTDKICPKVGFPWNEVSKVSRSDNYVTLDTLSGGSERDKFRVSLKSSNLARSLVYVIQRNHENYSHRRKDTSETEAGLKEAAQRLQEKKLKRKLMIEEKERRVEMEKKADELKKIIEEQDRLLALKNKENEEMDNKRRLLEEQLARQREEKDEYLRIQGEFDKALKEKDDQDKKNAEMLQEMKLKEESVEKLKESEEKLKLEMEQDRMRLRDELLKLKQENETNHKKMLELQERERIEKETVARELAEKEKEQAESESKTSTEENGAKEEDDQMELKMNGITADQEAQNIEEMAKRNEGMVTKMKELKDQLDKVRVKDISKTDNYLNEAPSGSKFKTLAKIRCGNTHSRINVFELL